MDTILSVNTNFKINNPVNVAQKIASAFKSRRLDFNITQAGLSKRSGVSLGSIKRFETTSEISLKNLLMLAIVLNAIDDFNQLFCNKQYNSIKELVSVNKSGKRQRASIHGKKK